MTRVKKGPCFRGFQKIIKRGSLFYEKVQSKIPFSDGISGKKVKNSSYMAQILVSIGARGLYGAIGGFI